MDSIVWYALSQFSYAMLTMYVFAKPFSEVLRYWADYLIENPTLPIGIPFVNAHEGCVLKMIADEWLE